MPLYHFVTNDLPTNTKASELDDRNAAAALKVDAQWTGHDYSSGSAVTIKHIGRYIRYLTITGFLPPPAQENGLPDLLVEDGQRDALQYIGGRGGATR
jgi:L-aminoadipate-semialdehyde dehydrogenase